MTQESTSQVKFKITSKKMIAIIIILAIAVLAYVVPKYFLPITSWNYNGQVVGFRIDLRQAQKIPIVTKYAGDSDKLVRDSIVRPDVQNITFIFEPTDETNNALYIIEETEVIKALTLAYISITPAGFQPIFPTFNAQDVSTYSNITATQFNPKIVLVHPNFGNETLVRQDGYIIYVEAKNVGNFDSNKIQFDLATVRLMMAVLNITIQ